MINISITPEQAAALETIWNRYYFDLFKTIRESEEEEYQFRNAIQNIVDEINRQRERQKKKDIKVGRRECF